MRRLSSVGLLALVGGAATARAETITLTFEESEPLTYFVSYVSTGSPTGGALEFDVNYGSEVGPAQRHRHPRRLHRLRPRRRLPLRLRRHLLRHPRRRRGAST